MKSNATQVSSQAEILAVLATPKTRAVLVTERNGQLNITPVVYGESVLNIEKDLQDHLDDYPYPNEFLETLRDYCSGRLAARAEARATGGISIPRKGGWDIAHINAFDGVPS